MDQQLHEIRLVGRGGQGVVTAGDLLGLAAVSEGRWAQSIPTFGPERRGALSQATLRIADDEILIKCTTARPDVLLVLDPTIWRFAPVTAGIREGAVLVFNTPASPEEIDAELRGGGLGYRPPVGDFAVLTVDATAIALEVMGRAITNTAMMGALAGATGIVGMDSVERVLVQRFDGKGPVNVEAARRARDGIRRVAGKEA